MWIIISLTKKQSIKTRKWEGKKPKQMNTNKNKNKNPKWEAKEKDKNGRRIRQMLK